MPASSHLPADLPNLLTTRLAEPLPGDIVRRQFAPRLAYGRHQGPPSHNARPAAVLILLVRDGTDWRLPLTVRPPNFSQHAGQISFPGGRLDRGETPEQAALRECEEELGVARDQPHILGRLSQLFIFNSNFLVTPCIGVVEKQPEWKPNPAEVKDLLVPTLDELSEPEGHSALTLDRRGVCFVAPCIRCGEHAIWGATCMILGEFLSVLGSVSEPHR